MGNKKIIKQAIENCVGEKALPVVNFLSSQPHSSEFDIAKKLKKEVKEVRNVLYQLFNHHLVDFTKKKDKEKGWYIYYWTFNKKRVEEIIRQNKLERLKRLSARLKRENNNQFFTCQNNCLRLDFDQVTEFNFKCPECGKIMNFEDNSEKIIGIKKEIKKIKEELDKQKIKREAKKQKILKKIEEEEKKAEKEEKERKKTKLKKKKTKTSKKRKNNTKKRIINKKTKKNKKSKSKASHSKKRNNKKK